MNTPRPSTLLYRILAVSALGAGTLGLLLPLLPTTPFILLALWASARGAPEWHERIRLNPRFGPSIQAWQTQRAVSGRAKFLACGCMVASWTVLWFSGTHDWILFVLALLFSSVAAFLVTRPAPLEIDP